MAALETRDFAALSTAAIEALTISQVTGLSSAQVLAMGTPREVQTDPGVIEAYLGSIDDVSSLRRVSKGVEVA